LPTVNSKESESDHKRIEYTLDFDSTRTIEARNYHKANWVLFRAFLARATNKIDSRPTWDGPRLDLEVEKLVKAIDKALDKACPKKTITVGVNKSTNKLDWYQPETKKLSIQVKQYAFIYRDNQTDANRQRYKLAKKQLQSNIRANKREAKQIQNASIKDMKSFSKTT
jgi:hypothetical protein